MKEDTLGKQFFPTHVPWGTRGMRIAEKGDTSEGTHAS
jgi:hypothetical protein